MSDDDRRRHIRTLIETDDLPLDMRVAGLLVLVYATTVTEIVGLTLGAVDPGPPTTLLLAGAPVPVPEPVAFVLRQHLAEHRISRTLSGTPGPWLFPGSRPGRHLHRRAITLVLQRHGIPIRAARNRALQQLVTTAPPARRRRPPRLPPEHRVQAPRTSGWELQPLRGSGLPRCCALRSVRTHRDGSPCPWTDFVVAAAGR